MTDVHTMDAQEAMVERKTLLIVEPKKGLFISCAECGGYIGWYLGKPFVVRPMSGIDNLDVNLLIGDENFIDGEIMVRDPTDIVGAKIICKTCMRLVEP